MCLITRMWHRHVYRFSKVVHVLSKYELIWSDICSLRRKVNHVVRHFVLCPVTQNELRPLTWNHFYACRGGTDGIRLRGGEWRVMWNETNRNGIRFTVGYRKIQWRAWSPHNEIDSWYCRLTVRGRSGKYLRRCWWKDDVDRILFKRKERALSFPGAQCELHSQSMSITTLLEE